MFKRILTVCLASIVIALVVTFLINKNLSLFPLNWIILVFFMLLLFKIRLLSFYIFPRQEHEFKHLLVQGPLYMLLTFGLLLLYDYLTMLIINVKIKHETETFIYISIILSIFFVTISEGIDFFHVWKKYLVRAEQIEKENLLAQYETLRNQLNPHFLFNGLNTLISFIESNDTRASTFAQNLSDFLKYLLNYHEEELITVAQEIEIVNQYVYLQEARFEDNLFFSCHLTPSTARSLIPPLTMQILVENAIKHNKITSQHKLYIDIFQENEYIYVKNNIQLKNANYSSTRLGIKNIEGRYKLFTERKIVKDISENYFIIGVPILEK